MDERNVDREVVAAADGVTLRKRFEAAEFHQPAVVYEFESDRDEAVTVQVIEGIPEGLDPADIGFLGSSVDRFWEIKGPKLVFENPIEPNAEFTTACTARGERADAIRDLLGQPDVFEVSEVGAGESAPDAAFTRSADGARSAASEDEPTADTAGTGLEPGGHDRIVEQFVTELRAGEVSPESIAFLRNELGAADRPRRSVEARLKQVQTDVADVRAYTNALEAFIDEEGSAREVIDRFEARLSTLEDSIDSVDRRAGANEDDLSDVRAELEALQTEIDSLAGELETVATGLDSLEDALEAVEERLPEGDVEERIDELDAEIDEVAAFADSLRDVFRE